MDALSLNDALNHFCTHLEANNTAPNTKLPLPPDDQPPSVTTEDVKRSFLRVKPCKSAGLYNIPSCVLKDCIPACRGIDRHFQHLTLPNNVPLCFKSASIIPVPNTLSSVMP